MRFLKLHSLNIRGWIFAIALFIPIILSGQNPIVPPGVYIADPSARVWNNGKIYIYGSVDESMDYYCSHRYHVLSSEDMKHWNLHENTFSSKGGDDQVDYSDNLLYAPDCMEKDGKYYLYYCLATNQNTEGVAVSESPEGPFKNGQVIHTGGYNQIDPGVFIDEDGQGYYVWGQFSLKMAKLKPNMLDIDTTTIHDNVLTEKEHYFHEGCFMTKRKGIYYLVYADISREGMPTCIGYATSKNPMGPYTYGGVIIDNDNCDPGVWNNHGSIAEWNNQWYVFYHRSTHNSVKMRKACVEPITFLEDGSIPEVEMTTQGSGEPLPAFEKIDAERACLLHGDVRIRAFTSDNEELGSIGNDDKAAYKYIDFGNGITKVKARIKPGRKGGSVVFTTRMPWGKGFTAINVPPAEGEGNWMILEAEAEKIEGVQTLWVKFCGEKGEEELFAIDWFQFE